MTDFRKMSLLDHIDAAERHSQRALEMAYDVDPQSILFRVMLGRAQSMLLSLANTVRRATKKEERQGWNFDHTRRAPSGD